MSEPTLDWLVVGTGDIVQKRVAPAVAQGKGSRFVGVCGGRDRAAALASKHGAAEVFDSIDEALEKTKASAVYVATPVFRHSAEAIKAIRAGKHVLVEKPLGLCGDDARRIRDAARQANVIAGCAYYRRTYPRYAHAKDVLASGVLGKIVLVRTANLSWFSPKPEDPKFWRVQKDRSGGGPLADVGTHMLDIIVGLLGAPGSVFAQAETLVHGQQSPGTPVPGTWTVEDSATVLMKFAQGAHGVASFGWNTKTWAHEFEIVGSEGKLTWMPADTGKVVLTVGRDVKEFELANAANVHQPLVEDFVEAVRQKRGPVCPLDDAVKTNLILDAVYASAATGKQVKVAEV